VRIAEIERQHTNMQAEMTKMKTEFQDKIRELGDQVTTLQGRVTELEGELAFVKTTIEALVSNDEKVDALQIRSQAWHLPAAQ
jgi:peptidoglycan hydrolase CwlO-like protein